MRNGKFYLPAHCPLLTAHSSPPTAHCSRFRVSIPLVLQKTGARFPRPCCARPLRSWRSSLSLRVAFRSGGTSTLVRFVVSIALLGVVSLIAPAQQTNPVDRKVTNPMTDTPNVNPLTEDQPIRPQLTGKTAEPGSSMDRLNVDAGKLTEIGKEKGARVVVYEENVDARIGTYRLQADKI